MTNTTTYLLVTLSLVLGCFFPIQGVINAQLARWLNHPLQGALVSFAFGTCMLILANLLLRIPPPEWTTVVQVPKYLWVGGIFGVIFITASIFLIPVLGAATFLSSVVAGQLIGSVFIDHIGFLGLATRPIDRWRILGVILIVLGVYFIRKVR